MKVEDFYNKPKVTGPPNKARVISFVNETREQEYEEQLATLQEEITRLTEIERNHIENNAKFQNTEERLQETMASETELQTKLNVFESEMARFEQLQNDKQELEDKYRDLRGQFDAQTNTIQNGAKEIAEQKKKIHQFVPGLFLIRAFVYLLFTFCTLRGPGGGLPYMYMYTATHQILSFALF